MSDNTYLDVLIRGLDYQRYGLVNERYTELAKSGSYVAIPQRYAGTSVGDYLARNSRSLEGIYRHQAMAADLFDRDQNVVQTTSTGSGKSRTYMAEAFHLIMNDPKARVLAFFPLVALGRDQHDKWTSMAKALGLSTDVVCKIDGTTRQDERLGLLAKSKIALLTPDIAHAWMLLNVDKPPIQEFIKNRRLTILDEIDSYSGLFGTNMHYMLKRLEDHQSRLEPLFLRDDDHRYVATSATLPDAARFFEELTGFPATEIGESENGAPQNERAILHHGIPWDERYKATENIVRRILTTDREAQGIVFFDSRRDVEDFAARINKSFQSNYSDDDPRSKLEIAIPQKAGYSPQEQSRLERLLKNKSARLVVATSAWESGVDYDFTFGINIGVPLSKKSARQRIGRVGRQREGLFIFVAQYDAFKMGNGIETLSDYLEKLPNEAPKLYPRNEFIQIAQAFCYNSEFSKLTQSGTKLVRPMDKTAWPRGFLTVLEMVKKPWENLSGEKRFLIPPAAYQNKPQRFHPFRSFSGSSFLLSVPETGGQRTMVGSCSLAQALQEYPPGAIVRHAGQRRRVSRWETLSGNDHIILTPYSGSNKTAHRLQTEGFVRIAPQSIVDDEYHEANMDTYVHPNKDNVKVVESEIRENPFIALVRGQINHKLTSFVELTPDGKAYPYRYYNDHELTEGEKAKPEEGYDYGPPRQVKMSTTGLVLYLPFPWFHETARAGIAQKIIDMYADANHINRADLGYLAKSVSVKTPKGKLLDDRILYIYDKNPGSLGLSHGLMNDRLHDLRTVLRDIARSFDPKENTAEIHLVREIGVALRNVKKREIATEDVIARKYPKPPKHSIVVVGPQSYAHLQSSNGSSTVVKVVAPAVVEGIPGYYIEKTDRRKFFASQSYVTVAMTKSGTMEQTSSGSDNKTSVGTHFVAASQLSLKSGKRIAMNVKTGALFRLRKTGTENGEPTYAWIPFDERIKPSAKPVEHKEEAPSPAPTPDIRTISLEQAVEENRISLRSLNFLKKATSADTGKIPETLGESYELVTKNPDQLTKVFGLANKGAIYRRTIQEVINAVEKQMTLKME